MRGALVPLVPLYAAALGAKNAAFARGWVKAQRLRNPVISVGNLSVGGSGKTPLTIRLAELLREQGIAVDVLSRGYGRRSDRVGRVNPEGSAEEFGDEPLLMARPAGIPVYVGASRFAAGRLAEEELPGRGVHLLDDGFQHRKLARDVDIVVLHRSDFAERLLPAGRLREPVSSLERAQILVLREEDGDLEAEVRGRGLRQPIWWMERRVEAPALGRVAAFCAIARPEEFFAGLRALGLAVAVTRSWRDHHAYSVADLTALVEALRAQQGAAFVTTEKDWVRLSADQRRVLERAAPLHAAKLVVRLRDEAAAMAQLLAMMPGLRGLGSAGGATSP